MLGGVDQEWGVVGSAMGGELLSRELLGRPWYLEPQRRLEAWEMFPSGVGTGQVQETKYHTVLTTETARTGNHQRELEHSRTGNHTHKI